MNRLKQLRLDALLTPEELGERAGVSGVTVRNLENGKTARVDTLGRLAIVLNARPSELLLPAIPPSSEPEREAAA